MRVLVLGAGVIGTSSRGASAFSIAETIAPAAGSRRGYSGIPALSSPSFSRARSCR
jgi:hypothetical protein